MKLLGPTESARTHARSFACCPTTPLSKVPHEATPRPPGHNHPHRHPATCTSKHKNVTKPKRQQGDFSTRHTHRYCKSCTTNTAQPPNRYAERQSRGVLAGRQKEASAAGSGNLSTCPQLTPQQTSRRARHTNYTRDNDKQPPSSVQNKKDRPRVPSIPSNLGVIGFRWQRMLFSLVERHPAYAKAAYMVPPRMHRPGHQKQGR